MIASELYAIHTHVLRISALFWKCQLPLTFKELNIKCCVNLLLKTIRGKYCFELQPNLFDRVKFIYWK